MSKDLHVFLDAFIGVLGPLNGYNVLPFRKAELLGRDTSYSITDLKSFGGLGMVAMYDNCLVIIVHIIFEQTQPVRCVFCGGL